jgi:uncharacterized protein YchJ
MLLAVGFIMRYKIYKIKIDGSSKSKLNDNQSDFINVVGNWIYYCGDGEKLYKIRTDGSGKTKLNNDNSFNINIAYDWVYYEVDGAMWRLYRIKTDGTGRQLVN